jgi:hypothetical protein
VEKRYKSKNENKKLSLVDKMSYFLISLQQRMVYIILTVLTIIRYMPQFQGNQAIIWSHILKMNNDNSNGSKYTANSIKKDDKCSDNKENIISSKVMQSNSSKEEYRDNSSHNIGDIVDMKIKCLAK